MFFFVGLKAYPHVSGSCTSKELTDKYGDGDVVQDLIDRKTKSGQYESNPDFPSREDWV